MSIELRRRFNVFERKKDMMRRSRTSTKVIGLHPMLRVSYDSRSLGWKMNLATDRQANDGSLKWESSKAWYVSSNGEVNIVSGVGLLSHIVTLREWYKDGALPDKYPAEIRPNTAQLIVIRQDGLWVYDGTTYPKHRASMCVPLDMVEISLSVH